MKLIAISTIALAALVGGCMGDKKPAPLMTAHNDVTDIAPGTSVTPTPGPAMGATPAPVSTDQNITDSAPTGQPQTANSASARKNYVVKKGDTLWSIAKVTYGDGRQYTKIVSANPGLSPSGLHVGQQIVIP